MKRKQTMIISKNILYYIGYITALLGSEISKFGKVITYYSIMLIIKGTKAEQK